MIAFTLVNHFVNLYWINEFKGQAYSDYNINEDIIIYKLQSGNEQEIRFGETAVAIVDSKDLSRKERFEVLCFISYCLNEKEISCSRSIQNLEGELALHNLLCRFNYKTDQTQNTDLDYTKDRRWYVNAATAIMQILGL